MRAQSAQRTFSDWLTTAIVTWLCSVILSVAATTYARALVGDIDRANRYEWVVKVTSAGPRTSLRCSGVAISPMLVMTAAHCLFQDGVFRRSVAINIVDGKGKVRRLMAASTHVSDDYPRIEKQWRELARRDVSTWTAQEKSLTTQLASLDIGMIVLKEPLAIRKSPRMISDTIYSRYVGVGTQMFIGVVPAAAYVAVGLGAHACLKNAVSKDWSAKGCITDDFRRFVSIYVTPSTTLPPRGSGFVSALVAQSSTLPPHNRGGAPVFVAWRRRTGEPYPILPGDSGGALFLEIKGEEPILIGIWVMKTGAAMANSLLYNSDFIKRFLSNGAERPQGR